MENKKKCKACLEEKELCEFWKRSKNHDNLHIKCKQCCKLKNKVVVEVSGVTKKCKVCEKEKDVKYFQKSKKYKDGYFYKCKECAKDRKLLTDLITPTGEIRECHSCLEFKDVIEFYNFDKTNNKCKKCTLGKNETKKEHLFKRKLEQVKGEEYELVGEYNRGKLNILHKTCGNVWEVSASNVMKRNCGHCNLKNKSGLCSKVEKYLIENSICYKSEIRFDECKDKLHLPFDYGIYNCEEKLLFLIEVDGEQHFKETGYSKGGLKEVQRRDAIKDTYCLENNIKLYRIPYFKESEIEVVMAEIFSNIVGCCKKEYIGYVSKSIVTEEIAKQVRTEYLNTLATIKSVSDLVGISTNTVSKILKYMFFPNIAEELKKEIDIKCSRGLTNTSQFFKLSQEDIDKMISLKKEGFSDTKIAKIFNVYRRTIKNFIPYWEELSPKKGVAKVVKHIETGLEFKSLKLACDYFSYIYANEGANIRNNSKIKKFNYV